MPTLLEWCVTTLRVCQGADVGSLGAWQAGRPAVRFAVVLWGEPNDKCRSLLDCPVLSYAEVLSRGHRAYASFQPAPLSSDQLATIVYTSGTTGNPKVPSLPDSDSRSSLACGVFEQDDRLAMWGLWMNLPAVGCVQSRHLGWKSASHDGNL